MPLHVKIADEPSEFEQIFALNYRTFSEEIPQHPRNGERKLVDKFHSENVYIICLEGGELAGMVALRDRRPFSLDSKIPDLDAHIPSGARPVEIRLLAVIPDKRHGRVFGMLMERTLRICMEQRYEIGLISGRIENIPLYAKFGFKPFGSLVGSPGAWYQPMRIERGAMNRSLSLLRESAGSQGRTLNFLPGPIAHSQAVREALSRPARSHRSGQYASMLAGCKAGLLAATGAGGVEILVGTGTLANDAIAGQLSLRPGGGMVICNGEFGERLLAHARGFGLKHTVHSQEWGTRLDLAAIATALGKDPRIGWVWAVHCETSTGQLNPAAELGDLCRRMGVSLCLDCISSLGVTRVDLGGVEFASGVSGKGVGGYSGLAMVFYRTPPLSAPERLPPYLDLGNYRNQGGIPFSGSSNLLAALATAVSERMGMGSAAFIQRITAASVGLRTRLAALGMVPLLEADSSSPAVLTIPLPEGVSSLESGSKLEEADILVNYRSGYLSKRNWLQVCLMADHPQEDLESLLSGLARHCAQAEASAHAV